MKINIYQINHERDDKRLMFFGLDEVQKLTGSKLVKAEIYDKIFSGDVDCHSLEDVYRKFNEDHPAGYKGRSLSVSDVVEIVESDNTEKGFYYCDNFGFKTISFKPEKAQDTVSKNRLPFSICRSVSYRKRFPLTTPLKQCSVLSVGILRSICPLMMMSL